MNEQYDDVTVEDPELIDSSIALVATEKAQIDVQIATAKEYPRSITQARQEALTLATLDENVAGSCFYALPRGGKSIEGPSARLAEIIAYSFTNLRVQGEVASIDEKFVTLTGTCLDLERNTGYRVSVKRRITGKYGRFNDDMIGVTSNAGISIALRNAVFKVVPRALWESIYIAAREASLGKAGTIAQKRTNAFEWFAKTGMNEAQVCEVLGVKGLDDVGVEELIQLRGLRTALTDGDTTVEQLLAKTHEPSDETNELNKELKGA